MEDSIQASLGLLGDVEVGQTVNLKVASIDEETGTATLVPLKQETTNTSAIERAAGEMEMMEE